MKKILKIAIVLIATNSLTAQNPLIVPPTMSGTTFNITIAEDSMEFFPGHFTKTWGMSFPILGPTLIMQKGDVVTVNFDNQLSKTTTMHWHGVHLPSIMDGGPHTVIPAGGTWSPTWTVMDKAATYWYHPHLHHKTYEHVMKGLAGFVIVKDDDEAVLDLPRTYGIDDIPVALQTKVMDANYQIDDNEANAAMDTLLLVNATRDAYFDAPAQVVRLRLLDGSLERSYNIGLSNNANFFVIASDGGLLNAPVALNRLLMSPGERYEILIDLTNMQNDTIQLINYGTGIPSGVYGTDPANLGGMGQVQPIPFYSSNPLNGADFPLLTLNIGAPTANAVTSIPATLVNVTQWSQANVDENRQLDFSVAGGMGGPTGLTGPFLINNAPFDMNVINYQIPINNVEIWTLNNQSMISHPFHIHDVQFNILEINGVPPPAHMQGWKDMVLVPAFMGSAKFITKFEDFTDPVTPWMYHCHIITHEDTTMMGQFTVVDAVSSVQLIENNAFSIFPNPANSHLNIELKDVINPKVEIKDLTGKIMFKGILNKQTSTIDVSKLSNGIYFIKINNTTSKFIKQ
ncbi:MAG: multicopper oxidase domain-containing protein [Flavobacteriales bacterium]|nr:multicopper oxidase domain-containing protein [Flavobacteriales bacterium]